MRDHFAVGPGIVANDGTAILRQAQVKLKSVTPVFQAEVKRGKRVLGNRGGFTAPPMTEEQGAGMHESAILRRMSTV
jgi:hypothetical protein